MSFLDFIDQIAVVDWHNRLRKVNNYPTAIISLDLIDTSKRIIPIGKYRQDYKPFVGDVSTQRLDPINSDVVELVTLLYDHTYQAIAMDFSQYGLKASGIEKYFNTFLPQNQKEYWQVKLYPIMSRKGIEVLRNSHQIRSIEISLNLERFNIIKFERSIVNDTREPLILNFLNNVRNAKEELDAHTLKMEFVSGSSSRDTMNLRSAMTLLETLDNREEYISKLKVKYRDDHTEEISAVDLKNFGGQLKDVILKDSMNKNPQWRDVGIEMADCYGQYETLIAEEFQEHIEGVVNMGQPELHLEPRDIHRISRAEE